MNIDQFISEIRKASEYNEMLYTHGDCYKFAVLLRRMFGGEIVIEKSLNHAALKIDCLVYDVTGRNHEGEFSIPTKEQTIMMQSWSFCKSRMIQIAECPCCEEPILV